MSTSTRRYDIDWLRVITIGLLLVYHIGIVFQPWGVFIGFLQSDKSLESLWLPMSMLNVWRIPLLFFISGMGVGFALQKRNWKQLMLERTRRIFLPFLFGSIFVVPIHIIIWQKYYTQDLAYIPSPGHLWFLANIFIYVLLLSPLFFYLKKNENGRVSRWFKKAYGSPLGLALIVGSFMLEAVIIQPDTFEMYAMTLHGFLLGLLAFFFGFTCIHSGDSIWQTVLKWKWLFFSVAAILFAVRLIFFELQSPSYLMAIESNLWIFAILGLAYRYMNHPSKTLHYLSQGAYPIYIIHMIFLYLGSFLILPLDIHPAAKFLLVIAFTSAGCFTLYDLIIKRIRFIRPLFGLKNAGKTMPFKHKKDTMKKLSGMFMKKAIFLFLALSVLNVRCQFDSTRQYSYKPPEYINDGLDVGSLEEVNIDTRLIEKAVDEIEEGRFGEVHSLLIFRNDKLVLEEYFKGHDYQWDAPYHYGEWIDWDRTGLHQIQSVTKSVTSTCIGIAVKEGFIESVHQSIFDYLPEHQHLKTEGKENITIEHLLTMTSGLQWDEWNAPLSSQKNDIIGIWFSGEDPITYYLKRPLVSEPGTHFTYSGGGIIVLGEIIRNATNMSIDEFSGKYLFEPLGVDSFDWWNQFENGVFEAAGCLRITPRSMVKIGVTFLNGGIWKGNRIVSEQWVAKSAVSFPCNNVIRIPGEDLGRTGYGYTWWTKQFSNSGRDISMFLGNGWGGQKIIVIPDLNTVIVFSGGSFTAKVKEFKILKKQIIPAIH